MKNEKTWNKETSKWKSAIEKGLDIDLKGNENILYLGASSGTTVEQLSKRTKGLIFAVEKSYFMAIPLVKLAMKKENIFPLYSDASDTEYTNQKIKDTKIDILFMDIPSFNQIDILIKNSNLVEKDCKIYFSLKTQSISQKKPETIKNNVSKILEKNFIIEKVISLEPDHKKHYFFILSKK